MPKRIILDVDTGSDDAVAIMAACLSDDIEVVAACTVWGNLSNDLTTDNTLRVLHAMGADDVPVYKGCGTAMTKYLVGNRIELPPYKVMVDGKELRMHYDHLPLPAATRKAEAQNAIAFYVDYLRNAPQPVTLVPVGPLTNLGVALSVAPDIVRNIEEIVIMGGGEFQANVTLCAEANVWHDPEAAQIVMNSGARIQWVPLDATHAAPLTLADCDTLQNLGTVAGDFAAELIRQRIAMHNASQPLDIPDAAAVHDALAVCAVIDRSVLQDVQDVHVSIGMHDFAEGKTIVDRREAPDAANCRFAYSGNREKFAGMLCSLFARGPKRTA